MEKLKGNRVEHANGMWYTKTEYGRVYDSISKDRLIDGGFHSYGSRDGD